MAKITSSSNRSKRTSKQPVTKGQNPQRANRQAVSQAKVTSASNGKPSGTGAARVTTGMGGKLAKVATAVKALKAVGPVGAAAAVMAPRRLGDATMKGKPTGNVQGPAVPKRLTQSGLDKGSFDNAFRQSRKAGKKEFSWRGKRYNTKIKGEK